MAALPRQAAAHELGISVPTLRRLTAGGVGKVRPGGKGRGNCALYDVATIAQLMHAGSRDQSSPEVAQLQRGALALTVSDALANELLWVEQTGELYRFGVPSHHHADLIGYLQRRITNRVAEHFGD